MALTILSLLPRLAISCSQERGDKLLERSRHSSDFYVFLNRC